MLYSGTVEGGDLVGGGGGSALPRAVEYREVGDPLREGMRLRCDLGVALGTEGSSRARRVHDLSHSGPDMVDGCLTENCYGATSKEGVYLQVHTHAFKHYAQMHKSPFN